MEYLLPPIGTLTTTMAAQSADVAPATIRDWVRRGLLTRCGGSPKRPIYRLADVQAARYAAKPTRPGQRGTTAA
ncbi:helix-turn-helix domain-containing protein [Streptomyces halstedii]|uniref:Helix-turn-helix domain-containing protein n=1 Tax=Streptomyces halstedii TaxID=1944 RepID=A0ABS6TT43_STRHA|nr:helix-turn-helix domain-containing protein [Streptomyces halstedii]MBV7671389.1 helix-turn-helix domain-containing protein [Streptomyces halstedii]